MVPGIAALVATTAVALIVAGVNSAYATAPVRAVTVIALVCGICALVPPAVLWIVRKRAATPEDLALMLLLAGLVILCGITAYQLWGIVSYPADFLVWSEGDFVNDIIKLRTGYPFYSSQLNNDSFVYMPGSQLLTYGIALLTGHGTSVPVLRAIQLGYTVLAVIFGALAVGRIVRMSAPDLPQLNSSIWIATWVAALFLIATNGITNAYIVNLHNDGLAQLINVVAFWLLVEYAATRDRRVLIAMAFIPALGYFVKQSLGIWAVLYCFYLLAFDRPRSFARLIGFGAAAFGLVAMIVGGGYLIYGQDFIYWTITVLKAHRVEPLRSVQHVLDSWTYFAAGLAAALVLLRGPGMTKLFGPWLVWLGYFSLAAYTSGIAWMLNHMGPGSLLGGVWLLAAVTVLWHRHLETNVPAGAERWLRAALPVGIAVLMCSGLGVIRIPLPTFTPDAIRYAREVEAQFKGADPNDVLLDAGSWVYVKGGVVMKDRAPSIGERGYSMTGDFSAFIDRLKQRKYAKILVRNFHSPDFWYDHASWQEPSGIRKALEANYHEVGMIAAVMDRDGEVHGNYLFSPISILVRNER